MDTHANECISLKEVNGDDSLVEQFSTLPRAARERTLRPKPSSEGKVGGGDRDPAGVKPRVQKVVDREPPSACNVSPSRSGTFYVWFRFSS